MDKSIHVVFCHCLSNALCAPHMYVEEIKVLGRIVSTDQVVHNVRVSDALLDRVFVTKVKLQEGDATQVARNFKVPFRHFFAERYDDIVSGARESIDDVATEEASSAEDGYSVSCCRLAESEVHMYRVYRPPSEDLPPRTLMIGFPVRVI